MAELLKNAYSKKYIKDLAAAITAVYPEFKQSVFISQVIDSAWPGRELKDRMYHIASCLHDCIFMSYPKTITLLSKIVAEFDGFEAMFFPAFVELYGIDDWTNSITALELFTQYSSSEFAVRPFIIQSPKKMMLQMNQWAKHKNYHVRRLASEGCRPRLPWAIALPEFKRDPKPILSILERLKNDPELYVRRSVANNLNDIAKDHPDIVLKIAKLWSGHNPELDWLVKHACRTLLKKGDTKILRLFGFKKPSHVTVSQLSCDKVLKIGASFNFQATIKTQAKTLGRLRLEYAIHYVKSNGSRRSKVFQISETTINDTIKKITKKHSFKEMSTRKHYPGVHKISIIINGEELKSATFTLRQ